jgi:hypothetical protein
VTETAAAGLRAWARGAYDQEAGVELLVRAFGGRFAEQGCPWIRPGDRPGWFWVDVLGLSEHLGVLSGGEQRILAVVASLIDGRRAIDHLGETVAGLDRRHLQLVLAALAHAAGSHEHAELVGRGEELVFVPLQALVAWPEDAAKAA